MIQLSLSLLILVGVNSYAQWNTDITVIKNGTAPVHAQTHSKTAAKVINGTSGSAGDANPIIRKPHPTIPARNAPAQVGSNQADSLSSKAYTDKFYKIVSFENVSDVEDLSAQLKNAAPTVRLSGARDFSKNKKSECNNKPCVVVSDVEFAALNAAKANGVLRYEFKEIAKRTVRTAKQRSETMSTNPNKPAPRQSSMTGSRAAPANASYKTTGLSPISGNDYILLDPNPDLYIPDGGYQWLGAYLPAATAAILSWSAVITDVWYEVSFWHEHPGDLHMRLNYNDTTLGGVTNVETTIYNYVNNPYGWNLFNGWTSFFNGLHPDSFYMLRVWDDFAFDDGDLDYFAFDIYWKDFADYKIYTGAGANNGFSNSGPGNRYLTVASSVVNDSAVDGSNTFGIGWYLTKEPPGGCATMNTFDANASFFVDYNTVQGGLLANTYVNAYSANNVDLYYAQNANNNYMTSDWYCLWTYADDLNNEDENNEVNNVAVFNTAFYFADPTSVKDVDEANTAKIFPNPVQDVLNITLGANVQADVVHVSIVDMNGRTVVNGPRSGTGTIQINLNGQAPGVYNVRIIGKNNRVISEQIQKI